VAGLSPLPSVRFLVDAARAAPARRSPRGSARPDGNYYERTLWVMDLFERVAERNRPDTGRTAAGPNTHAGGLRLDAAE
jgi:hypothetical protein